jgi:hypothetical protein
MSRSALAARLVILIAPRLRPIMKYAPNKEKWHRSYSKPAWYRSKPTFPSGRDPWRDLFKDNVIDRIVKAVKVPGTDRRELQKDLREIAEDYLTAALTTPLGLTDGPKDITLTKRREWVDIHLVQPSDQLLQALSADATHLRSEWPDPSDSPEPNLDLLVTELKKLHCQASELSSALAERAAIGANHTTEFKYDLVKALECTFRKHFPRLPVSRGTFANGDWFSRFVDFVQTCIREIFPNEEKFSDYIIKHAIKKPRPG